MTEGDLREEIGEWVMDAGTTAGRLSAYDKMITTFWVTKSLLAHVLMERAHTAAGDAEPACAWKSHYHDCKLMHQKIDLIAAKVCIPLQPASVSSMGGGEMRVQVLEDDAAPSSTRARCPLHHSGPKATSSV